MTDPTPDPELPRAVALAWGVAAHPQRGPKREMSVERIVDVAVELADAGGLAAVSMSAVASALGFTPMSLYRYVTAKDDLVLLMQERGIGVPPESITEADGWRAGLDAWTRATVGIYLEHAWMLDIPISSTPVTPNNLAWLESALQVLEPVPVSLNEKASIVLALIAQARWEANVSRGYAEAAMAAGSTPDDLEIAATGILEQLVTPEEFPFVHAALRAGVFSPDEDASDNPFEFGRERVLDGVESYLAGAPKVEAERPPADPLAAEVERDPKVKDARKARREVEKHLREARKRERDAARNARERIARQRER
ncbi:MAG: TetR/AcrR family transcriptional regulator [Pseudolysinimonas sp.]